MEVASNWSKPLPPGFRFHPTHEEAINYYLIPKVRGYRYDIIPDSMIPEVDILVFEPSDLPVLLKGESTNATADNQDEERWFYCLQTETQRVRRTTEKGLGFWKKTGADLKIKARGCNKVIGTKKTLVFHEGSNQKGIRTNWVIHEYHARATELDDFFPMRKNYVLCRLKHKQDKKNNISEEQEQPASISESEIEAMSRSLIMPSVEQESQAQIGSSDHQQLLPCLPRSGSDVSFNLQHPLQPSPQSGNNATINLQHVFQPLQQSLDDCFTVTDKYNLQESFIGNHEDDETEEFLNSVLIDADYFGGDQMQLECDQTSSPHTEHTVLMQSQRVQTTQGVIPLDEKGGLVQSKRSKRHALSTRPTASHKKPAYDVRTTGRDAQNVMKHELVTAKTDVERASSDESSAKAKVREAP